MSNKEQLQTNNLNLDALITRVIAAKDVVASLPEAGGGGSNFNIPIDTGTFLAGEDITGNLSYAHNLGQVPNFVFLYADNIQAQYTDFIGYLHHQITICDSHIDSDKTINAHIYTNYGGSTGIRSLATNTSSGQVVNASVFMVVASANYKLKAGVTYRYVCGILPGI